MQILDEADAAKEFYEYYPFGKIQRSQIADFSVARFKFTGKELDDENGLDWYDFGARYYDAAIGRWVVADPLAEKYPDLSPYVYCANNPINSFDPNGKQVLPIKTLNDLLSVSAQVDPVMNAVKFSCERPVEASGIMANQFGDLANSVSSYANDAALTAALMGEPNAAGALAFVSTVAGATAVVSKSVALATGQTDLKSWGITAVNAGTQYLAGEGIKQLGTNFVKEGVTGTTHHAGKELVKAGLATKSGDFVSKKNINMTKSIVEAATATSNNVINLVAEKINKQPENDKK